MLSAKRTNILCCRLYRAYQKLYASMHDKGNGPHKTQFRRDDNYGKMCYIFYFNPYWIQNIQNILKSTRQWLLCVLASIEECVVFVCVRPHARMLFPLNMLSEYFQFACLLLEVAGTYRSIHLVIYFRALNLECLWPFFITMRHAICFLAS